MFSLAFLLFLIPLPDKASAFKGVSGNVVIHAAVTLERSENKNMIPLAGFSVATMFLRSR